jgi:Tfp pilus assembly protein PilF
VKGTSTTLLSDPSLDKTSSPPQIEESPPKSAPAKRGRAKGHSAGAPKKQISVGSLPEPFSSSPSAVPLRKEVSTESIGVKNESVKDHSGTSETLTQFNLGIQFYQQRDLLKAIQAYQKVIQLDPSHSEAYNNLGTLYQELGDLDRAFQAYQKSIEVTPRYDKAFNNLGTLLFLKERYEESIEAFQKALAINSNNIESHINLGVLFKKQGQFDKAIENYQKAISLSPLNGETHYNIGLLYEQLEKVDLAITHYQTFIQLSSNTHPDLVLKVQRHLNHLIKTKGKER